MSDETNAEIFKNTFEKMYVYDPVNRVGFPITRDILCVDIDSLSHDERVLISGQDSESIEQLLNEKGDSLSNQMALPTVIFDIVLRQLLLALSTEAEQRRLMHVVRETLQKVENGEFNE